MSSLSVSHVRRTSPSRRRKSPPIGQAMSTLMVQKRHLADMRETDKYRFLDSPVSSAGLFGYAVESFAQQFSATQKQTEAIKHIRSLRRSHPVRALRTYVDRTQSFRTSEQLFVCYGGQQKGKAVTKQRIAHWIVDVIVFFLGVGSWLLADRYL